tara:strand:- start:21224 stop:21844 length:621 start_codon:yes stop_codon:yes gene_type:complete
MKFRKDSPALMKEKSAHPVMNLPADIKKFDFRKNYNPEQMTDFTRSGGWGIGGYLEKRSGMYLAPQYDNRRNIHMGIDIWAKEGEPVFSPLPGRMAYKAYHGEDGNYGATIVLKHQFKELDLYALYGHLSIKSLERIEVGAEVARGELVGWLGSSDENGNWPPHLHYQISFKDPGEADMPGVVAEDELEEAVKVYPDPRILLGDVY